MQFDAAIECVLELEGIYSNDKFDTGGETKYGISKSSYPNLDIKNLTWEAAKQIYKRDFWDVCLCDSFPDPLRLPLLEGAVNHGPKPAIKMLQKALSVDNDGSIGPKTLAAANKCRFLDTIAKYYLLRLKYYESLPTFTNFGDGWKIRCFKSCLMNQLEYTRQKTLSKKTRSSMPPLLIEVLRILSPMIIAQLLKSLKASKNLKEFKKDLEKRGVPKFLIDIVSSAISGLDYVELASQISSHMAGKGRKTAKKSVKKKVVKKAVKKKVVKKAVKKKVVKKAAKKKAVKKKAK